MINTKFAQSGSKVFQAPPAFPTVPTIEPGTYSLGYNDNIPGGFYFDRIQDFTLPSKIYGHNTEVADRILKTFVERPGTLTSAALSGQKGSGKTLTAKEICIKALALGIPVVEISVPFSGPAFNMWLQNIKQPVIFLVDEFEKVYKDEDERNRLLSLLDGTFKTHKMFIFTMNKPLNNGTFEYFFNRPGRVYFNVAYGAASEEIIREYCADHLQNQSRTGEVVSFSKRFSFFTLDILTILIREMNAYPNDTCSEIAELINIKPDVETAKITFDEEVLDENNQVMTTAISEYNLTSKDKGSVVIPYDFSQRVLSGSERSISIPLFTQKEVRDAIAKYHADPTSALDTSIYFNEDDYDEDEKDQLAAQKKEYVGKCRGFLRIRFGLDKDFCVAEQDDITRDVTIHNKIAKMTVVIRPAGRVEPKLRFQF